ncbi:pyridoxal phosphate-dependent aminotransferase [Terracidiphilus gabretensis]|uniref:pyridoxal phosphate-dependent aminotransferase n=1 Tax=Terracidiphilus gabretensis TaxID=1577687 RepID=UPI00071B6063|nr:histidinol-phosphate transaminase [Terracidiphilus gabretensis]
MSSQSVDARYLTIALSSPKDRKQIYSARHEVYALELHQHQASEERLLRDALDERNEYIVVKQRDELLGFVSVTPPGASYSVDKYFNRSDIPVSFDQSLYEIRLLTVLPAHRGRIIAPLLMYGALRYIESHGGSQLVAIGRREVAGMYSHCGMKRTGASARSGAVEYELMTGNVQQVYRATAAMTRSFERLTDAVDWQLPFAFNRSDHCNHGGALWEELSGDFSDLGRSQQIVNADVLDAWFDPAPAVLSAISRNLPLLVRTSPPTHAEGLVKAISHARGVPAPCILPSAGSSALIFMAFQSWFRPDSRVLLLDPMYGEYRHVLKNVTRCVVDSVVARAENAFHFDLREVEERLNEGQDAVVLVNPNSPTGTLLPPESLAELIARFPGTRFWIDETYIEFCGAEHSLERFASESVNAFVCKSMSKVYALSGLRVAYLVGPSAEIAELSRLAPPWAVSLPAQIAAVAALDEPSYYATQYRATSELREQLASRLRTECGIAVFPSATNCLLCALPPDGPGADEIVNRARKHNLFIRSGAGIHPSLGPHTIRIAVKSESMNERIVAILRELLSDIA